MPEIKRAFQKSKMNKDMDERLVPSGEYRDALNVEINTSEGSNVGTVQSVLGSTALTSIFPTGSTCVGSIADSKNDKIYWLVAGPQNGSTTNDVTIYKDWIVEYDLKQKTYQYVIVDIWKVVIQTPAQQTSGSLEFLYAPEVSNVESYNNTGIRIGMNIASTYAQETHKFTVQDIQFDTGNNRWKIMYDSPLFTNGFATGNDETVTFTSDKRLLNFEGGYSNIKTRFITGINILDGMLFWTDNYSEPKKINIERCILGTGGTQYLKGGSVLPGSNTYAYQSADTTLTNNTFQQINPFNGSTTERSDIFHTRLVSSTDGVNLEVVTNSSKQKAVWLKEEHITVIKKSPLTPPHLEMSSILDQRTGELATTISYGFSDNGDLLNVGDGPYSITFDTIVDFRVGDSIILTNDPEANPLIFKDSEVRIIIDSTPSNTPSAGPYGYIVSAINPDLGTGIQNFFARVEKPLKAIFKDKFVRFAYRYKYKDGEYSTISPWSELAFLPDNYNYSPKEGYNLGMENQLRSLKITDYVVEDAAKGEDVVEIDILFKDESSPNIYTVKTLKPSDDNPMWPDRFNYTSGRGEYQIESELIHAALPSDQLIRPWDNVPIRAKAQDITANRLIYGNYVQNYDVVYNNETITPDIQVTLESSLGDLARYNTGALFPTEPLATPSKSVKSLRTYQIGVVYRDEYGRETPVLAGDATDSTITIEKKDAFKFNKLKAQIKSNPPDWAKSWKFFIKETSNEYYSLAMDRWYNAKDGNVWISFPSSERNKITEETFLILKKRHTQNVAVTDDARYKVIAIENEAPEYIKRNTKIIGKLENDGAGPSGTDTFNPATSGFPYIDFNSFEVETTTFMQLFANDSTETNVDLELKRAMHNGFLYVRVSSSVIEGSWYKIANISTDAITQWTKIKIDGKFGEDMRFASPSQDQAGQVAGLFLELATKIPENKAEFDGKFFVKIRNDVTLQSEVLKYANTNDDWVVEDAMSVYYINYQRIIGSTSSSWTAGSGVTITNGSALMSSSGNGQTATYNYTPKALTQAQTVSGAYYKGSIVGANKKAVAQWWAAWGGGWFIDSAITANEDADNLEEMTVQADQSNYYDVIDGTHGVFDAGLSQQTSPASGNPKFNDGGTGVSGPGTAISISWSGIYQSQAAVSNPSAKNHKAGTSENLSVGSGSIHPAQSSIVNLLETVGTQFRFPDDPEKIVYTIRAVSILENRHNYDSDDDPFAGAFELASNKRKTWKLTISNDNGNGIGVDSPYNPIITDPSGTPAGWTPASSSFPVRLEFVTPFNEDDDQVTTTEPAVWETEPKEDVGLDIYYEATKAYPIDLNYKTNEQFAKYGSTVLNETTAWTNTNTITVTSWSDNIVTINDGTSGYTGETVAVGDIISFTSPDGGVTRLKVKTANTTASTTIAFENTPHEQMMTLPFTNCYSFQNGVESNRIRDDYNASYIKNGVKASTVLAKHYEQERRAAGLIHSGIYNSTSGVNDLNQFIQGNPITKDLNPRHGSIQMLFNRNTDLVAITEDKCFKIMADKDALYKADGSPDLIAKAIVLGQATPYAGDYGTTNPESFASDLFRSYFVDRTRGKVCRLSMDGVTPISSAGMHDWFADNLKPTVTPRVERKEIWDIVGSFDANKSLYNVSIKQKVKPVWGGPAFLQYDKNYTISYGETAKGWVSFKSFYPESGLSINNEYYTFRDGEMWKHHVNDTRNNFYNVQAEVDGAVSNSTSVTLAASNSLIEVDMVVTGTGITDLVTVSAISGTSLTLSSAQSISDEVTLTFIHQSSITAILNDQPESIKSFNSLNYEGSQAKITQHKLTTNVTDANGDNVSQADGEYYNLNTKAGWYVDSFNTNEQEGTIPEFLEKEGKWFNYIRGVATTHVNDSADLSVTSTNLDQQEFSVQGIGVPSAVSSEGTAGNIYKLTVLNNTSTTYETDGGSGGTDWDSTAD